MGCRTSSESELYIPELDISVKKPVLEAIPSLDSVIISPEQEDALRSVFSAYNNNLLKLVTYSMELEEYNKLVTDYYLQILKTTN